jgi:hypothetical protein
MTEYTKKFKISVSIKRDNVEFAGIFSSFLCALINLASLHTGNCNNDNKDDFITRNGTITRDTDEFGKSWLHPLPSEEGCSVAPELGECMPLHPDQDPCFKILDEERFGRVSDYMTLFMIKLSC